MMVSPTPPADRQEVTTELTRLDHQLRELSQQWEDVEREITHKIAKRRALLARQEESTEDHTDEINRLQSDVFALRDRLTALRDAHLDFSALYRILEQART